MLARMDRKEPWSGTAHDADSLSSKGGGNGKTVVEGVSRFGLETRECETSSDTLGQSRNRGVGGGRMKGGAGACCE
jgi:hypothetical protein